MRKLAPVSLETRTIKNSSKVLWELAGPHNLCVCESFNLPNTFGKHFWPESLVEFKLYTSMGKIIYLTEKFVRDKTSIITLCGE